MVNVMCRYNTTSPTPYDQIRPTLLNPAKEATSVSDSESIPSPCTSPPQARRHYGESITSLGKASIMGEHRDTWRVVAAWMADTVGHSMSGSFCSHTVVKNYCRKKRRILVVGASCMHSMCIWFSLRVTGAACTAHIVARQAVGTEHELNKSIEAISFCLLKWQHNIPFLLSVVRCRDWEHIVGY